MTSFQAESKKHIEKVSCKEFTKDYKEYRTNNRDRPLKFSSKSEWDVTNNLSSNSSIASENKLRTTETA